MKSLLIDHPGKVIVVIVLYLLSLFVWWVKYGIGFLLLFDEPSTPTLETFLAWWWLYPVVVIFSIILGILSYLVKEKSFATFFFYLPLGAAVLLAVPVFSTEMEVRQEERERINAFWGDPPKEIVDLDLEEAGFGEVVQDPVIENVFILPDSIEEENIIDWNGDQLIYLTPIPPEDVREFYHESYEIIGFTVISSGGNDGFGILTYEIENGFDTVGDGGFMLLYSMSKTQFFTKVGITKCADRRDCRDKEDSFISLIEENTK